MSVVPGTLSSVGDLRITQNTTSLHISWTPPFSLDIPSEGFGPNMWYSVLIYNVTDEHSAAVVPCTDCDDITDTYYTFTLDYLNSCHKYQFSVVPFNGAGQGETSSNITVKGMQPVITLCYNVSLYTLLRKKIIKGNS